MFNQFSELSFVVRRHNLAGSVAVGLRGHDTRLIDHCLPRDRRHVRKTSHADESELEALPDAGLQRPNGPPPRTSTTTTSGHPDRPGAREVLQLADDPRFAVGNTQPCMRPGCHNACEWGGLFCRDQCRRQYDKTRA